MALDDHHSDQIPLAFRVYSMEGNDLLPRPFPHNLRGEPHVPLDLGHGIPKLRQYHEV